MIVHKDYLEDIIKKLHQTGLVQIENIITEENEKNQGFEKATVHPETATCNSYELRLSRLIDILQKLTPNQGGIKALLKPQIPQIKSVEDLSLDELYSVAEGILGEIEKKIIDFDEQLSKLKDEIKNIQQTENNLTYFVDFDIDLSEIGESQYLFTKIGMADNLEELSNSIKEIEEAELFSKQFGTGKKTKWAIVIISHISQKEKIEKICRERLIEFDFKGLIGKSSELVKTLKNKRNDLAKEQKNLLSLLQKSTETNLSQLRALREQIQLERARKEISKNFLKSNSTYVIKGWILDRDVKNLQSSLTKITDDNVIFEISVPSINPDNPPTYFDTPKWAIGFKHLLEMFATPKYNEINPTAIMGVFFVLFFGVMLGDAGYGIALLVLSLIGYFKLGKYSYMIRTLSFMAIWMGVVTTIMGFLTNSFFGDLIPRFFNQQLYPPFTLLGITFPVEPLSNPLAILVMALILGLAHLNLGIILGIYQAYKRKEYRSMLTEKFCFIPLQIGGGILIGNFILGWQVTEAMFYLGGALVVVGIILLFVSSGPIGFFGITGYVGDWLSYARLLALGLATAGMALAFNVVSQLLGDMIPVVGVVILVILLVFMHTINLGLQALGAAVHSLRLQYVEFFNRFYEGGGHQFTPFKIRRRYTKLEDNKN
ncbi:MAG: V-type ATP synthase subunit I [Candidatus Thermoplasmatota archaeon]|nr:V-type ATP synthase subunit I [Candidatus Thermoplasmatota archaeon]